MTIVKFSTENFKDKYSVIHVRNFQVLAYTKIVNTGQIHLTLPLQEN